MTEKIIKVRFKKTFAANFKRVPMERWNFIGPEKQHGKTRELNFFRTDCHNGVLIEKKKSTLVGSWFVHLEVDSIFTHVNIFYFLTTTNIYIEKINESD